VTTKHRELGGLVPAKTHAYVIVQDRGDKPGATIIAFDRSGKQLWSVEGDRDALFGWSTVGDDLLYIRDNVVHVYAGATGKETTWEVYWNASPVVFGDTVYATPVDHSVEAYEAVTGKVRWKTKLPDRGDGLYRWVTVVGAADGHVYAFDDDTLRVLDAATGHLESSYGVGLVDRSHLAVHEGTPAVTYCSGKELVALDPSTPADEHHVKLSGRIRCRNCTKETELEVRIGDAVAVIGKSRRFSLEVTARGSLPLLVRDATFSSAVEAKTVSFTADRSLELGELSVKVPEMAPGED
jgi:hypothetical protein